MIDERGCDSRSFYAIFHFLHRTGKENTSTAAISVRGSSKNRLVSNSRVLLIKTSKRHVTQINRMYGYEGPDEKTCDAETDGISTQWDDRSGN